MKILNFFDQESNTFTYLVYDLNSKEAIVIDPVMDTTELFSNIETLGLRLTYILETHIHADHISGAKKIKETYKNAQICISENLEKIHNNFKSILELEDFSSSKTSFDIFLNDNDKLSFGDLKIHIITTPGHTPACICYLIADNLFTGDTLFMPDFGSGRCDFPGGSAKSLFNSVHQKLFKLPSETKVFVGHDYGSVGREIMNETTIGDSMKLNHQIGLNITETEFINFRESRDNTLSPPKMLESSLRANLFGGM